MIIGNGDIASAIPDRPEMLFFASGVSNSNETKRVAFDREEKLLLSQDKSLTCVYFSSINPSDKKTAYYIHKKNMECLVKKHFKNYIIVRLGNIDWGNNPNTFVNFITDKIEKQEPFEIRDEIKHIIIKEDFKDLMNDLPQTCQSTISASSYSAFVKQIIKNDIL